jgi:hypothetical protein
MNTAHTCEEFLNELEVVAGLDLPALSLPITYGLSPNHEYWIVSNLFHTDLRKVFDDDETGKTPIKLG